MGGSQGEGLGVRESERGVSCVVSLRILKMRSSEQKQKMMEINALLFLLVQNLLCIFDWPRSRRNPRPNPGPSPNPRPRPAAADYIAVVPACFLT